VGARGRQDVTIGNNMKVQAELRALYMHRFGDLEDSIDGSLTGGQVVSLGTQDRPEARDAAILGAGVTLLTANSINFYLDYNGQFLDGRTSSFFSAGIRYLW
jgi:outer membrane autotransporter protein